MTWRIVWTRNALSGLRGVASFKDELRAGEGAAFVHEIFDRVESLGEFPLSAPAHPSAGDPRIRRLTYKVYAVVYRVVDEGHILQMLAVRHQRQRPLDPEELP